MNSCQKSFSGPLVSGPLFAAVLTVFCSAVSLCSGASPDPFLDGKMPEIDGWIKEWASTGTLIAWLTFTVAALGIVVAALQAAKLGWIKAIAALLAVTSALVVAYNHQFYPADYRSYQKLSKSAKAELDEFRDELEGFSTLDEPAKQDYRKRFGKLKAHIHQKEQEIIFGAIPAAAEGKSASVMEALFGVNAYADGGMERGPAWIQTLPVDDLNFYFLGIAEDKSLETARVNALANAKKAAGQAFEKAAATSKGLSEHPKWLADLSTALVDSAEVVNSYAAPSQADIGYRAYVLLRLPKALAGFTAESVFVDNGIPYDQTFLKAVSEGSNTLANSSTQTASQQRQAINAGFAYIQFADENNRGLAEALQQRLSSVISAPGIERQAANKENAVRFFHSEDAPLAFTVKQAAESFLSQEGYPITLQLDNLSGTKASGKPKQIEIWLAPVPPIAPRIYLEVDKKLRESQPDKMEAVRQVLTSWGYETTVEDSADVPKNDTRVFFYKASDSAGAAKLLQAIQAIGLSPSQDAPTRVNASSQAVRPGHYDLRIGAKSFESLKPQY